MYYLKYGDLRGFIVYIRVVRVMRKELKIEGI